MNIKKQFLPLLAWFGLMICLASCVAEVGGGGGWYHDGPWLDGGRRVTVEIHPPGFRR